MNLIDLPFDVLQKSLCHLSGRDIARFGAVSRECHTMARTVHPRLITALGDGGHPKAENNHQNQLFRYQQSLRTYEDVERWAETANGSTNKALKRAIVTELHKREFLLNAHKNEGLTHEQQAVVNTRPRSDDHVVMVQAYAGTGKTTTLFHYAQRWADKRVLYLAYNRALADESKERFGTLPNVHVTTIHALALREYGGSSLNVGNVNVKHVKKVLEIPDEEAKRVLAEFELYCSTDSVSEPPPLLWEHMFERRDSGLKVSHDAYLKAFQRTSPTLEDYDVIMLDEVQDCTDCILDLVLRQKHATRLFVGDVYQKIYGFRHVNNPFRYITTTDTNRTHFFYLSVSFRFGFDLMRLTNVFLRKKYNEHRGFSRSNCRNNTHLHVLRQSVHEAVRPGVTILCRYNLNVLKLLFELTERGFPVRVYGKEINFEKERDIAQQLWFLHNNEKHRVTNPKIAAFESIQAMQEHHNALQNNKWKNRIQLMLSYNENIADRWRLAAAIVSETAPAVQVTTAHQSKGSEFDSVLLNDDFTGSSEDAHNTLYVAMTRAKKHLYLSRSLYTFYEKTLDPVMYPALTQRAPKTHLCTLCKKRNTNRLVCTEDDPMSIVEGNECEVFTYRPACVNCVV
jgi:superfamily I DNA/RNA helicase